MLRVLLLTLVAATAAAQTCTTIPSGPEDGVVASPANHTVLFETADVRVLEVTSAPHTEERPHTHARPAVLITDGFSTGTLTSPARPTVSHVPPADLSRPRVVFLPPDGIHQAHNLGDTPFHAIRVELKHPGCTLSGKAPVALDATDGVAVSPAHQVVLIENADVRVLEVLIPPHSKEAMHTHAWPAVLYVFQTSTMVSASPAVTNAPVVPAADFKPVPRLVPAQGLHTLENVGDTPYRAIRVELKLASPTPVP